MLNSICDKFANLKEVLTLQKYSTRQRKAMLDYLIQHKDESVTANQIAAGLEESGVSISAVYRNLASLEEEGKVTKIMQLRNH